MTTLLDVQRQTQHYSYSNVCRVYDVGINPPPDSSFELLVGRQPVDEEFDPDEVSDPPESWESNGPEVQHCHLCPSCARVPSTQPRSIAIQKDCVVNANQIIPPSGSGLPPIPIFDATISQSALKGQLEGFLRENNNVPVAFHLYKITTAGSQFAALIGKMVALPIQPKPQP